MIDTLSRYTMESRSRCLLGMKLLIISLFCQNPVFLTYLVHGAEFFLSRQTVLSYSRNSEHFMEPEGSLPHSQVPITCPYPGLARSISRPIPLPEDPS